MEWQPIETAPKDGQFFEAAYVDSAGKPVMAFLAQWRSAEGNVSAPMPQLWRSLPPLDTKPVSVGHG